MIKQVIFDGLSDVASIKAILNEKLSDDLKKLLSNIILEQLPRLKKFVVNNQS